MNIDPTWRLTNTNYIPYVVHEFNAYLTSDFAAKDGPNIGTSGKNLTISFLSMNRVNLSERLCDSLAQCIPDFAGEVLAVDNGSSPEELGQLRALLARQPYKTRLVELGLNRGVAGGRNSTIQHVKTDWLMCLDNDIYFVSNPLERIQRDIAVLGCHFLSLPLLEPDHRNIFAMGGLLHVSHDAEGNISVGGGSAYAQRSVDSFDGPGSLASFMYGGSCVFNVQTFKLVGGYDEALFIGFEDTDFSIRLFRQGYKVGVTGAIALVHDHPPPVSTGDIAYEQKRFSDQILRNSAEHLEKKYGYKFWDNVTEAWLCERQNALGLDQDSRSANFASAGPRPKVGLVIDTAGWAFDNIASQMTKHLSSEFEMEIIASYDIGDKLPLLLMLERFDLVHFFWRKDILSLLDPSLTGHLGKIGIGSSELFKRCLGNKPITTSVYDHLFLSRTEINDYKPVFETVTGYSVSSQRLYNIYSNIREYPTPAAVISDGVDLDLFFPNRARRFPTADQPLIVGWAGNSAWASEIEDFKGFHTILQPALTELAEEGVPVVGHFADRQSRMIPHRRMRHYYSSIDVFVCSSKIEGTPNPVLEAMACGVPVISTDVGIVPEVLGDLQQEFILPERSKECLKTVLRRLNDNREILPKLSEENLLSVQSWAWSHKVRKFEPFFRDMLQLFHQKM